MPLHEGKSSGLYYELDGHGSPLVLIAGYACDLTQWSLVRRQLAARHRLLLLDNRDAGHSHPSDAPYSIAEMAADIADLMQSLGIEKAHILGHSMGGAIAQTLATEYPHLVDRLILSNTFIKFSPVTTAAFRWLLTLREQGHPAASLCEGTLPWIFSNNFLAQPGNAEAAMAAMLANPQTAPAQARQFDALTGFDSHPWFRRITAPTLVIAGEEDICAPPRGARELAGGIAGAKLVLLPEMGHVPLLEAPEKFAALVLGHLQ
jgi:pimeloyl-ACP methyl ester carboxylesterase